MEETLTSRAVTKTALRIAKREFRNKVIVSVIVRGLLMIIPILFSFAVDSISKGNYNQAYLMVFISIGVYILYRTFEVINTYTWHKLYNKMYQAYTDMGLQNTCDNSLFSLSRISIGEYINIMNNDINVICEFFCNLPVRIVRVVEFFVIFIYFFLINVYIGLAGVVVSSVAFLILYISSKKIETLNKKRAAELDKKSGVLHEILLCMKEIKGFNIFEPVQNRMVKSSDNYVDALLKQRVVEDIYKFGIVLLIELFRLGLFIYGIYLISKGQMAIGVLLVIYNYYAQLIDNFSDFATINVNYRNLKVSENRFNRILEYSTHPEQQTQSNQIPTGDITFNNILYGYRDNPTLDNVSFGVKAGHLTCIVGDVNSGKTGILDLLLKFNRQHTGEILIGETNITQFNEEEYYNLVASTSNDTSFFNVSIKENLSMIEENFEKIVDVCKNLGIHEYIIKLKDGYDTVLQPTGDNITPNIKQLLGIARVLLKDSKIMLFDDVFGTLDKKEDDTVMGILESIKKDHTIIIFTKEINILEKSDMVIYMSKNKVADMNTHKLLITGNLWYKGVISK